MRVRKFSLVPTICTFLTAFLILATTGAAGQTMVDIHPDGFATSSATTVNGFGDILIDAVDPSGDRRAILRRCNGDSVDFGTRTSVVDLNDRGHVAGNHTPVGGQPRAFLYRNGRVIDLGTLGGDFSAAIAMNNRDEVVGVSATATGEVHAFLWSKGALHDLGRGHAADINDDGWVVGQSGGRATLWRDREAIDLGTLAGISQAARVNNVGHIVGDFELQGGDAGHAFLWRDGVMIDLGTLGFVNSHPRDINDRGSVIVQARDDDTFDGRDFLYRNGQIDVLGAFGGDTSSMIDVNDHDHVVGGAATEDGSFHAFLWQGETMIDLGTLGGDNSVARAISNSNVVVGSAETSTGARHAFFFGLNQKGRLCGMSPRRPLHGPSGAAGRQP